jgi:hypothetical protein
MLQSNQTSETHKADGHVVAIDKIVRIGTVKSPARPVGANIFSRIQYKDGKLSISGVIGPMPHGNSRGGCGQIEMEFEHRDPASNDYRYKPEELLGPSRIEFAEGRTADLFLDLAQAWHDWHLNDMRAGCEHQRAEKWGTKRIEVCTWRLKDEVTKAQRAIKERALDAAAAGTPFQTEVQEAFLLRLPWEVKAPREGFQDAGFYDIKSAETKTAGWVYETEHPEGCLSKPCPVCGYKYGNAWKREEVPAEILAFLADLPASDRKPAWI